MMYLVELLKLVDLTASHDSCGTSIGHLVGQSSICQISGVMERNRICFLSTRDFTAPDEWSELRSNNFFVEEKQVVVSYLLCISIKEKKLKTSFPPISMHQASCAVHHHNAWTMHGLYKHNIHHYKLELDKYVSLPFLQCHIQKIALLQKQQVSIPIDFILVTLVAHCSF